jgi:hypothetical protein
MMSIVNLSLTSSTASSCGQPQRRPAEYRAANEVPASASLTGSPLAGALSRWSKDNHGQPCPKCGHPILYCTHRPVWRPRQNCRYYFGAWLKCGHCRTIYMIESSKQFLDHQSAHKPSGQQKQQVLALENPKRWQHVRDSESVESAQTITGNGGVPSDYPRPNQSVEALHQPRPTGQHDSQISPTSILQRVVKST